ncbi:MAG: hypothetical protein WCD11_14635, partial [Solirubrobacteraceae bacterium]
ISRRRRSLVASVAEAVGVAEAAGVARVDIGPTMPPERWNDVLGGGGDVPDPHGSRWRSSLP